VNDVPFPTTHEPRLDVSVQRSVRVLHSRLGGKDAFEPDRSSGDQVTQLCPAIVDDLRASYAGHRDLAHYAGVRHGEGAL
jgi:hypothetical protein